MKREIEIKKEPLEIFTAVNTKTLGIASNKLTPLGYKLYTYLVGNQDGYKWNLDSTAYAKWQGVYKKDLSEKEIKAITDLMGKQIKSGMKDLIEKGYMREISKNKFIFSSNGQF